MKIRKMHLFAALWLAVLLAWRFTGIFMAHTWVIWVWRVLVTPYFLAAATAVPFIPLAAVFYSRRLLKISNKGLITIRKLFLSAAIWLLVLLAVRILAVFVPLAWMPWPFWWVLITPYIITGAVTALVLLILTILCLGRIRYRIDASISEDKTADIDISYLMQLVRFVLEYRDGKLSRRLQIAGFRIGESKPRKKDKKRKAKTKAASTKAANTKTAQVKKDSAVKSEPLPNKSPSAPKPEKEEKEEKDRLKLPKKVKAVLTDPNRKFIINLCLRCLRKFFKALKPRHLDISGIIGFDDPCTTGWAMGTYEAAVGVIGIRENVRLLGNYYEKALELNLQAEGRTRLWGLIWPFIWLYLHKKFRVFLREHIL